MSVKNTKARDFAHNKPQYLIKGKKIKTVQPLTLSDVKRLDKAVFAKMGYEEKSAGKMQTARYVSADTIDYKNFTAEGLQALSTTGKTVIVPCPEISRINAEIRKGMMAGGYGNKQYEKN